MNLSAFDYLKINNDDCIYIFNLYQVVVQLANLSNFICPHQNFCHPNCYERQRRSCSRLVTALKKIYQSSEHEEEDKKQDTKKDFLKERLKRRVSIFNVSKPLSHFQLQQFLILCVLNSLIQPFSIKSREHKIANVEFLSFKFLTSPATIKLTKISHTVLMFSAEVSQE